MPRKGKTGVGREPSNAVSESRREGIAAPGRDHLGAIPARSPRLDLALLDAHAAPKILSRHLHRKLYRGYSAAHYDEHSVGAEDGSRTQSVPMLPQDAVAGPNRKLPVSLSDQALADGWRGVALSSPEKVPSSELAPLLRDLMYDGESFPRILGMPLIYGLVGLIFVCLALQKAKDVWGYGLSSWAQRRHEERHGRRTKGPELSLPSSLKMFRRDDGIRLKLQGESMGSKLVPWGRSYAIPKRLESSHIMLMGDTGAGEVVGHPADSAAGEGAGRHRHRL